MKTKTDKRKVAVYARVSTEHEAQISALGNQVQYFDRLFESHPEWELYEKYIDEGITGTSIKKRKNFLRMIEDANNGRFDLIVTREVSRFARNTVDTLQETRKLKKIGVEVYFTEDNIWTMNDEDGELRLTIMATLAQNESKKTSLRVKAGQMVSFQNAVPYGNGNILGYDRVGKEYVINPEQSETVRMIFELYLNGYGSRKLADELERRGRKTSTGLSKWSPSNISRILRNPFYCGTIVYRKQYVPDYLDQKKVNNHGEAEQVVVEGKHEPIISKEMFKKAEEIRLSNHQTSKAGGIRGHRQTETIWTRKLRCSCNHNFNRIVWSGKKGENQKFAFQCYGQRSTGTVRHRLKKGLSIEGVCTAPVLKEWELQLMAREIFKILWSDKDNVLRIANSLLDMSMQPDPGENIDIEIIDIKNKISAAKVKQDKLLELRLNEEISKELFQEKSNAIDVEISKYDDELTRLRKMANHQYVHIEDKIKALQEALEQGFDFDKYGVSDNAIEAFVDEIRVSDKSISWKLNIAGSAINCVESSFINDSDGQLNINKETIPNLFDDSTGCNCCKVRKPDKKYPYLLSINVDEDLCRESLAKSGITVRLGNYEDMLVDIYI